MKRLLVDNVQSATAVPRDFLAPPGRIGTVVVGSEAEFNLSEANPIDDLGTLRSPSAVMENGRWLSPRFLQDKLVLVASSDGN